MFPVTLLAPEVTDLNRQAKDSSESLCFVFFVSTNVWLEVSTLITTATPTWCVSVVHTSGAMLDWTSLWRREVHGGRFFLRDSVKSVLVCNSSRWVFSTMAMPTMAMPPNINSVFVYLLLNIVWYRLSTWRGHISCWNISIEASHSLSAVLPPCKQLWTCRVATITERVATVASSIKQHARAWQRWLARLQTCRSLGVVEVIESISILIFSL